ncbi:PEP-CTERM sorting domain-containing protein [Opitutaceae bacterium TAV4]|nr:PEP-CTERM sorting domain-containing protein [Opitutaceae bacterium TAV4]RRK00124.1 PEP-CTERM sorting domain-containing protein [Opitutaceae bacterium TAV3]
MTSSVIRSFVFKSVQRGAIGLAALLSVSAQAALIWEADFESYNTSSGAAALTIASTGAKDTFTSAAPNAQLSSGISEVRKVGVPSFMSGNALYIGGTSPAADATPRNISFALQQGALPPLGSSGVLVASFDVYNVSPNGVNTTGEARVTDGRSGKALNSSSTTITTAFRFTVVINRTGSDISLPGGLAPLATNSSAIYRFDGTSYDRMSVSTGDVISTGITGFATGFSLSSPQASVAYGIWLDNFGVWNSLTDKVNGISILSLAPGTNLSSIPEPSTVALLAGLAALAGAAGIRRLRV